MGKASLGLKDGWGWGVVARVTYMEDFLARAGSGSIGCCNGPAAMSPWFSLSLSLSIVVWSPNLWRDPVFTTPSK